MWEWASFNTPAPHSPGCGKICFNFWNKLTLNLIPKLIILQCGQPFNSSPRLGLVVMTVMVLMMISGKGSRRAISGRMTEARRTRMGLQLHSYCHHHHHHFIIMLSPSSSSSWWHKYVRHHAGVLFLFVLDKEWKPSPPNISWCRCETFH